MSKKKPVRRIKKEPPPTSGLLDGLAFCSAHGCPMITVGDFYHCLFEYLDEQIGMRQITDILPGAGDAPATLVFENGKTLPLLCPHCGEPQHLDDADLFLRVAQGRYLFRMGWLEPQEDAPEGALAMTFSSSSRRLLDEQELVTHWHSAYGLK